MNAEAQAKVDFYDRCVDAAGLYSLADAAVILGVSDAEFFSWLLKHGYLTSEDEAVGPGDDAFACGMISVKVCVVKFGDRNHFGAKTYITPKGIEYFRARLQDAGLLS